MVVYSCHCLNIQLSAEPPSHHLDPENLASCPLGSDIELVQLVEKGFQCRQKCLVHHSKAGPWLVYVCVLCKTHTHAVDQEANIVAVSTSMMKGKSVIDNMHQRQDFSSVFGLLLNQPEERGNDVQNQTFDTMQKQLVELQTVLSGYLRREEDAMEKRIRKYEEEQRTKFDSMREKCQKEKTRLISLLFNSSEGHMNNFAVGGDQNIGESHRVITRSHAPVAQTRSAGVADMMPERRLSRPLSSSSSRRSRDSRDLSPDDMFAMDDFEQALLDNENDNSPRPGNSPRQGRPTSQSSISSLESRLRQEDRNNSNHPQASSSRSRSRGKDIAPQEGHLNAAAAAAVAQQRTLLSSSVPISMPMGARSLHNNANVDDDIDEESTEFDDIPRHMQALSESIQERDRYIFGDRPRQRVNTGDFTQINWR